MRATGPGLAEGAQQVWIVPTEARVRAEDWDLLCEDERARADRFRFEEHRGSYVASRALVRRALSSCLDREPTSWRYEINAWGKPELKGANPEKLRFNLSRTSGMAVCAISRDRELGIDVEDLQRAGDTVSVAESYFAPAEVAALRALPTEVQRTRFFQYWTLKEAYIKARGLGLSLPLDQFAFSVDERAIRLDVDPKLEDLGSAWSFQLLWPNARHLIAVCVRRSPGQSVRIELHEPEGRKRETRAQSTVGGGGWS